MEISISVLKDLADAIGSAGMPSARSRTASSTPLRQARKVTMRPRTGGPFSVCTASALELRV